jgi:hypothetical protein
MDEIIDNIGDIVDYSHRQLLTYDECKDNLNKLNQNILFREKTKLTEKRNRLIKCNNKKSVKYNAKILMLPRRSLKKKSLKKKSSLI